MSVNDDRVIKSYMNYLLQAKNMKEKTQGPFIVYFDEGPLKGTFDELDTRGSWHGENRDVRMLLLAGREMPQVNVGGSKLDTRTFNDPINAAEKWNSITDRSFDLPERYEDSGSVHGKNVLKPAATAEEGEAARQRPIQARKIFETFHGVMGTFTTTFYGQVASPHGFYKADEIDENFELEENSWEESIIGQFVFASPEQIAKKGGARMNKNKRTRKKKTRKKRTRKKRTRKKRTRKKRTSGLYHLVAAFIKHH